MSIMKIVKCSALTALLLCVLAACGDGSSSDEGESSDASSSSSSAESATTLNGWTGATLSSGCRTVIAAAPTPDESATSSFGLTSSDNFYTVDTGAGLVFKIRRGDYSASTQAPGDIASMVYNDVEYAYTAAGSQLNAGAGYLYTDVGESDVVVSAEQVDDDHIKVTVTAGDMTHYYLAHRGENKIYMATVFTSEPNQTSESFVRFIVRAYLDRLPNGPEASDLTTADAGVIESADIFATSTGETRSKHYSNERLRDWYYFGATGTDIGMWMVRGNSEGMSGGPFYRALRDQATSSQQQLTYLVNYGMAQTEDYRLGVVNTYALVFTDGSAPDEIDTSWYADMDLSGWVDSSARGAVTGSAIEDLDSEYTYTVGFANSSAQYWTTAQSSGGAFSCAGMLPGDYTLTVYKNELAVASQSVTVTAGTTTSVSAITPDDPSATTAVWRIGDWDGSPVELLNGDKVTYMHPSDTRISTWSPGTFTVGTSTASSGFPAYSWKGENGTQTIEFTLTADQVVASTVRIGITTAYGGGRPQIVVNDWTSSAPSASTQPDTRTLTVGTYRGNNKTYTYSVPASALVEGTNTLKIKIISGASGDDWLSPSVAFDAVDFIQ